MKKSNFRENEKKNNFQSLLLLMLFVLQHFELISNRMFLKLTACFYQV